MDGVKKAYFIGIGGIGMSALAQLMADQGVQVSGSDREESPVTELLEKEGIAIAFGQRAENVPEDADLVVYSEAVWPDNPERVRAKDLGIKELSYFAALGEVSQGKKTIAVAGTHGKTTTTGMTASILLHLGLRPTAVVGSLLKDFGSNYVQGDSDLFVVEACEYKRDFLTLSPNVLVITNIEWDHTDYYRDLADVQSAFRELAEKVPADGAIIADATHPNIVPVLAGLSARIIDYRAGDETYELVLPGDFNQDNARAAVAAACFLMPTASMNDIRGALSSFRGTWRRFEYKGRTKAGAEVYDDYAHHPTAIKKTLAELKKRTRGKLFVAFHPHLYSRTRDLLADFAGAFNDADGVFIAPIYAAREMDDGTVSSAKLAALVSEQGTPTEALSFDEIRQAFLTYPKEGDMIVTMGAGDIYKVADGIVA
ncbi:MAG: UDP-N-acetylmuramate--L-alanine ligase [Bacillota bacterium]